MDHFQIQDELRKLQQTLQAKGCVLPDVWVRFTGTDMIYGYVDYFPVTSGKDYTTKVWTETSLTALLDTMSAFVSQIKTTAERKHEAFLKSVADAIEAGREAGVETEFLSPLEATMRKLSENAIEHQSEIPPMPEDFVPQATDLLR